MMLDFNIVTLHKANNYGAVLQAFALKTFLDNLGYPAGVYDARQLSAPADSSLRGRLIQCAKKTDQVIHKKTLALRQKKFQSFVREYLNCNRSMDCRAFVAGSDQVWNPIVYNPDFFLEFVPEHIKRVSYAASLGVSELQERYWETYRIALSRFDAISVRENQGRDAIKKILPDRDIRVHPDPTLLLTKEQWTRASEKGTNEIEGDYVLLYILHIPSNIHALCKWIRKQFGARLVLIDPGFIQAAKIPHDIIVRDVGPLDFLALMRDSKAVVTTSFHGSAFSILFQKEFYPVVNPGFPSRMQNLLTHFGLSPVSEQQKEFVRLNYDWEKVLMGLEEDRTIAADYFREIAGCTQ